MLTYDFFMGRFEDPISEPFNNFVSLYFRQHDNCPRYIVAMGIEALCLKNGLNSRSYSNISISRGIGSWIPAKLVLDSDRGAGIQGFC